MRLFVAFLVSAIIVSAAPADADNSRRSAGPSTFMRVFGPTPPPQGYVQFCAVHSKECARDTKPKRRFPATPALLSDLDEVNRIVNTTIAPATDREIYGVEELWTLPTTKGDCEDYALLKRKILIARGWPASALLMTVVRDQQGEGHAVLTARTDQGDFILDNKEPAVKLWHETPYRFIMRQSYMDPGTWMSLDPDQTWQTILAATSQPGEAWSTRATRPD
ncbi:MAG: hypothetical protein RLZ98_2304 [Pseudomonadota bacterium]|jgi:predicted transglutaminase-like cysteine proteinase